MSGEKANPHPLDKVASRSGKVRAETLFERYERHFVIGMRLARLEDWRHNRLSVLLLEAEDYEPQEQPPRQFHGVPAGHMSMNLPYVVDIDDEQHVARVGRAVDAAAPIGKVGTDGRIG